MNQKLAKQLRRIARTLAETAGVVERELIENEAKRKYHFEVRRDIEGKVISDEKGKPLFNVQLIGNGMTMNNEKSFRGIYRNLKRDAVGKPSRVAVV